MSCKNVAPLNRAPANGIAHEQRPTIRGYSMPCVWVAIPARDEADELEGCLLALAAQQHAAIQGVVICLSNCIDDSAAVVRRLTGALPFRVDIIDVMLPPEQACAGTARRLAMDRAAVLAGPDGILLTTDADARAPPNWVAANISAIDNGADAVAGRSEIEPIGAGLIPHHLHAIDAREGDYAKLLDEIRSLLDPEPADPWPRHDEHCGASIAVTVAAYRRAGGMPAVPLAEDRAFFDTLRLMDARIRHAPEVSVVVSARLHGRAPGGMADTMRRRIGQMDRFLDARLEPALDAALRAQTRGKLRQMWETGTGEVAILQRIAARLRITSESLAQHFAIVPTNRGARANKPKVGQYFGALWAQLERQCPALQHHLVPLEDLGAETARAKRIRDWLRHGASQADTLLRVAAD
jgi:hypothetical protein